MFFTNKKCSSLQSEVESLTKSVESRDKEINRLNTSIALSDSTHELATTRLEKDHAAAILERDLTITGIKATSNLQIKNEVAKATETLKAEYQVKMDECDEELEEAKEGLHDEFDGEIKNLKSSLKTAEANASKFQGLYDGTFVSIKTLTSQLESANATIKLLVGKLPEMSAEMTSPRDVGATVNVTK